MDMDLKSYYELGVQKLWRVLAHFQTRVLLIEDAVGNGWGAWLEEGGDGRRLLDEQGLGFVRQQVPSFFTSERESCAERHLLLDLRVQAEALTCKLVSLGLGFKV